VLLAAPTALWALYALRTFGSVLPNTDAAKRATPGDSIVQQLGRVYAFGYPVTLVALGLLAVALLWRELRGRDARPPADGLAGRLAGMLPPAGWLLLGWSAITAAFYVANHTYVQTRYIFITAPGLTVAVFALAARRWPGLYRGMVPVALAFGVTLSALSTWPLVRNKVSIDCAYAELAERLRALPPAAPVAVYSIGEQAFLSGHPLIDTGGITRPGILPYLFDADDRRRMDWIRSQGAQYVVVDHRPAPGATLLWSRALPITGWYFRHSRYGLTEQIQLWKLPPGR
jgi:hypothetical protein